MAIGARTDTSADMMKKLLGEISNIMIAADAPVDFLSQLHGTLVKKLREPVDIGYASGQLGGGQPDPSMGMSSPSSQPGMGGGMSLAALMGGGGNPPAAGGLMQRPPQPSGDELRRLLRKVA